MTNEEIEKLAQLIVNKIFERQEEIDDQFLQEWQEEIILKEIDKQKDLLSLLTEKLKEALKEEDYKLASEIKKQIDKLKKL
tara:strand:- start:929 stop:1171 length:243 start_codon:yes stop_codon:yes gene_type:complete